MLLSYFQGLWTNSAADVTKPLFVPAVRRDHTLTFHPRLSDEVPAFVIVAPHYGEDGAHDIGVANHQHIPTHRVKDEYLVELVEAVAAKLYQPIVAFLPSRLYANPAVIERCAFPTKTVDGHDIPQLPPQAEREQTYDAFGQEVARQTGGDVDVPTISLDTFTPERQDGDEGQRNAAICIIAKPESMALAAALQQELNVRMAGFMDGLKGHTEFQQFSQAVAVNGNPYGAAMHDKLVYGLTIDVCSVLAKDEGMRAAIADILSASLQAVMLRPELSAAPESLGPFLPRARHAGAAFG